MVQLLDFVYALRGELSTEFRLQNEPLSARQPSVSIKMLSPNHYLNDPLYFPAKLC
jgi:hypothetical protein